MNDFLVECCANSVQSAMQGELGRANRIEFCTNLEVGGLTPSREDIATLISAINIPIRILIRPKAENFIYTEPELLQIIDDIKFCKTLGCEGIAIGALHKNGSIHKEQTKQLIKAARPMRVTFHRAFDEGNNLLQNLEDVIACGCDTLLTAGQNNNVTDGLSNLEKLVKLANNRISILAGSGVNHTNTEALYQIGIRNFHLSGSRKNKSNKLETDALLIKGVIDKLKQIV
ncbi:MAG: copper homeostasis protein CutC [Flavobacteriales bacterium]|jgi:copper homeostasis protein|nr:copper homeostasis protein CutC [Flavobacteriales bacterium]